MLTSLSPARARPDPPVHPLPRVDPRAPCFRWPAGDYDGDGVYDRVDKCNNTPKGCLVDEWGCSLDSDRDGECDRAPAPTEEAPRPSANVSETERQLVGGGRLRLENIYFETNSSNLLPESEAALNEVGLTLEKYAQLQIEIQGHTDTRGSNRHNTRLSQERAESVRRYFLEHFQLRAANLVAKGYGERRTETRERNDEERLRNRRVELRVLNPGALPGNVTIEHAP